MRSSRARWSTFGFDHGPTLPPNPGNDLSPQRRHLLEPDVVIYPRTSGLRGLTGANVLLVVEIADSSLRYDTGRKAALYASFGIRELWVIDAVRLTTRVFREPAADGYRDVRDFGPADRLLPLIAPEEFAVKVEELDLN